MHFYCRSNFNRTQPLILSPSLAPVFSPRSFFLSHAISLVCFFLLADFIFLARWPHSIPVCFFATLLLTTCSVFFFLSSFRIDFVAVNYEYCDGFVIRFTFSTISNSALHTLGQYNNHDGKIDITCDHNLIIFIDACKMEIHEMTPLLCIFRCITAWNRCNCFYLLISFVQNVICGRFQQC